MHLSKQDIENCPKVKRLNIVNSISGIKPGNLIATKSNSGHSNLAIFSSIVHLGSHPALLGFVLRPMYEVRRDSYENILENGFFTINQINTSFVEQAHYTSAKFEKEESEFEHCGFTEEYLGDFPVPFVRESQLKIGLKFTEAVPIKSNDTLLIIGEVQHILCPDEAVQEDGIIDLEKLGAAGVSGLNSYYSLKKIAEYPYARREELPFFKHEKSASSH